jgi:hypothetical protein
MGNKDYIENVDYYLEDGRIIFTKKYLKERGSCCGMEHCRHCPYNERVLGNNTLRKEKGSREI